MVFTVGWAVPLGCIWAFLFFPFFVLTTFKIDVCEGPVAERAQLPCAVLGPFCSLFSRSDSTRCLLVVPSQRFRGAICKTPRS